MNYWAQMANVYYRKMYSNNNYIFWCTVELLFAFIELNNNALTMSFMFNMYDYIHMCKQNILNMKLIVIVLLFNFIIPCWPKEDIVICFFLIIFNKPLT